MKKLNLGIGLLSSVLLVGCMPDSLTKYREEPVKSEATSGGSTSTSTTPSVNLSTLSAFQIKNISPTTKTTYHMHKFGQSFAATDCEIPVANLGDGETLLTNANGVTDTGANDIVCWLEAEELQLYHNGFDLQINVPANYCEYVRVSPFYFWKWQPANTQKVLKEVVCADAGYCAAGGPVTLSKVDKECEGDYSKQTPNAGPNCDEGSVIVNTYTYTSPATITVTSSETKCGGKRTACYGGPGVDYHVDNYGYPESWDNLTYDGATYTYSAKKMSGNYSGNRYLTNYSNLFSTGTYTYDYTTISSISGMEAFSNYSTTGSSTYTAQGLGSKYDNICNTGAGAMGCSGLTAASSAAIDYAMDARKAAHTTAGGTYDVQPFYEFTCLNWAEEVRGRIRLQVREWNQKFSSTTVAGDQVNRSNHSRLKKHSANSTDYETSGIKYWNDVSDWDTISSYGSQAGYVATSSAINSYGFSFPGSGL